MKILIRTLALLTLAAPLAAQTPVTGASTLAWSQTAGSLAIASAYRYDAQIDALPPVAVLGVVCTGATSPYSCTGQFPAAVPGLAHTIALAATDVSVTPPLTSAFTATVAFRFVIAPTSPTALMVVP